VWLSLDVALTLLGELPDVAAVRSDNAAIQWLRGDVAAPPGRRLNH
jgi:hypothetical protein